MNQQMSQISAFQATIPQFIKMLGHIEDMLFKAAAHADHKKFDVNQLFQDRLSPDMFPMGRQIQIACDAAKFSAVYLTGAQAPKFEDNEKTLEEFQARLKKTKEYLSSLKPENYTLKSKVELPRYPGKSMSPADYVIQYNLPNFYFHVTMTYALLRKNGVELGKMDFLGELPWQN